MTLERDRHGAEGRPSNQLLVVVAHIHEATLSMVPVARVDCCRSWSSNRNRKTQERSLIEVRIRRYRTCTGGLSDMRPISKWSSTMDISLMMKTVCLVHQLPEDQPSSLGLICCECKQRLDCEAPQGHCRSFWESQPVISNGDPCAVFTLAWDNFRIRSLHPSTAWDEFERDAKEVLNSPHR